MFLPIASLLAYALLPSHGRAQGQVGKQPSVVAGNTVYWSTPVVTYAPRPTMIYNCAKMAAICWNLQEFMTDNAAAGYGAVPLVFHYDPEPWRLNERREFSCPSSGRWQRTHGVNCGSTPGQPNIIPLNPAGVPLPPVAVQPGSNVNWQPSGPHFRNEIPNLLGNGPSGMAFTCEEMPAASWIEGGNGGPMFTHVNCAPMSVSCGNIVAIRALGQRAQPPWVYPEQRSEQNWQATLHGFLATYASQRAQGNPVIMQFVLSTESNPQAATAARLILPGYGAVPTTTRNVNNRIAVTAPVKCEGIFCHSLYNSGDFDDIVEIDAPPLPAPARVPEQDATSDASMASETLPPATLYLMA
ncbi:hypothetical protein B0I35DRAFT_410973 [Stachybotrys elegans]|uniref:Uncharacterized protein n=1 Tax=Stachybotrys elegans TaxID=80388 RepID=A0A8K0WPH6_9HYPO|nr:hypothetical protein B0I35DRAFT_410973 [Stachybotrys elegans]